MHDQQSARARWVQQEADRLGGWYFSGVADGWGPDGEFVYWHIYRHLDGREAWVWPDGRCDDPELQALLKAQAASEPREPARPNSVAHSLVRGLLQLLHRKR